MLVLINDEVFYLHIVDNVTTTDEIVFHMELCSTDCPTVEMAYLRAQTGIYVCRNVLIYMAIQLCTYCSCIHIKN